MANMGQLVRRQSSRELRPQKSYDRMELRELQGKLINQDACGSGTNYGTSNAAFKDDINLPTTTTLTSSVKSPVVVGSVVTGDGKGKDKVSVGDGKKKGVKEKEPGKGSKVTAPLILEPTLKKVHTAESGVFADENDERDSWDSKLTFLLATIGYAVGLGNVWRFPYLAQKNGGGAFLIPYFIMLAIEGMPIFFLELAIGQRLRKGALGVWTQVSPYLAGVGIASAFVSFNVALYYNTIISWCLLYFVRSFQSPLPWESCPADTAKQIECNRSSPTQYFWYRETLDISPDINTPNNFNLQIGAALFAAWVMIYLCLAKGIASSSKIVYITALFPYVVLFLFFCRGVTLDGMSDGILHLFNPEWGKLLDPIVWLEAGTQIFFSLGLGFGGLIAFASYNPVNNNCCRDAIVVSLTNCFTSLFAGIVIFAVLGFKAHQIHDICLTNANWTIMNGTHPTLILHPKDLPFPKPNTTFNKSGIEYDIPNYVECNLQKELDKGAEGTGLAFIVFTDAINQFTFSPFWAILFFSMLFTLGIDSQFGTLEGVVTSIVDMKLFPNLRKEILTGILCGLCCALSMIFAHGAGNYVFILFDSFCGNMPLLIIAFCECIGVSYIYGLGRFAEDIELMTGRRPHFYWMFCWKYISPVAMVIILVASWVKIGMQGSSYLRWDKDTAKSEPAPWPTWALVVAVFLVLISTLWIPIMAISRMLGFVFFPNEEPAWFPANDLRDFHGIVTHVPTDLEKLVFGFRDDGSEGIIWRTKPKGTGDEDEDDSDDIT